MIRERGRWGWSQVDNENSLAAFPRYIRLLSGARPQRGGDRQFELPKIEHFESPRNYDCITRTVNYE